MGLCAGTRLRFTSVLVTALVVVGISAGVAWAEPEAVPARAASACDSAEVATLVTPQEQQEMLDLHNALRAKYGAPPLAWDATLASCAQDWANQRAAGEQQPHRVPNSYGENVFGNWSCCDPAAFTSTPADPMGFWGGEEPNYDVATNSCIAGTVCGHFTQVVWSTTTQLGCGKALTPDSPQPGATTANWVCNYNPPGNDGGRPFDPAAVPAGAPSTAPPLDVPPPAEPPVEVPPPAEPPVDNPPADNPPADNPPADNPPADQPGDGGNPPAGDNGEVDTGQAPPDGG
jgi:hypothetical protein